MAMDCKGENVRTTTSFSGTLRPTDMPGEHQGAKVPQDDAHRVRVLRGLKILDTPPEECFDRIAASAIECFKVPNAMLLWRSPCWLRVAVRVLRPYRMGRCDISWPPALNPPTVRQVPIALVSLVDKDRQWFKARVGLNVCETSRDLAFCAHSILPRNDEIFEVPDAHLDDRFKHSPLVTGEPHIRFYAGAPLQYYDSTTKTTVKLGTLCIIDTTPRSLSDGEKTMLKTLSRLAVAEIELREKMEQERKAALDRAQQSAFSLAKDLNSSYISQVAHDLRTPLNSFSLGLQELTDSGLTRKQSAIVDAMETSAELMQLTCSKVLDLTALEHGKELKINTKTFDLVDVLRNRCATLQCHTRASERE